VIVVWVGERLRKRRERQTWCWTSGKFYWTTCCLQNH